MGTVASAVMLTIVDILNSKYIQYCSTDDTIIIKISHNNKCFITFKDDGVITSNYNYDYITIFYYCEPNLIDNIINKIRSFIGINL